MDYAANWAASGAQVPHIDWAAMNQGLKAAAKSAPVAVSWQTDFVNHLGRSEADRNPNAKLRIQIDPAPRVSAGLSSLETLS
jgi:hypothetical protein